MWYYLSVKRESEWRGKWSWVGRGIVVGIALLAAAFVPGAKAANSYAPILQPTIFWHDNQWETYENGQWVPYHDPANYNTAMEPEPAEVVLPEEPQPPETVDSSGFVPSYGWGFIGAPAFYRPHHHRLAHTRPEHRRPTNVAGRHNAGTGRTTIGMGRPNVGIGQTTIGIGQANAGIGHRNAGIGQTTIGIGQPNVGIGQNNAGIGQTTIGIGQPNVGIGQQMGSQRGGWGR